MEIDFTGVTNVFMGGNANSETTSLQCVHQGENELWNYTDKGYRWRMMGSTLNGYDSFSVGDVVCFGYGTTSMWTNMEDKTAKDCIIPKNYFDIYGSITNYVDMTTTIKMGWSDEIGEDGKVIGWHLTYEDNLDFDKNMCSHAYCVSATSQNGAYARFRTNSAYGLSGIGILGVYFMKLSPGVGSLWCTEGGNYDPLNYYNCRIKVFDRNYYINGQQTVMTKKVWSYTTTGFPSGYNVIFKRVKIAQ